MPLLSSFVSKHTKYSISIIAVLIGSIAILHPTNNVNQRTPLPISPARLLTKPMPDIPADEDKRDIPNIRYSFKQGEQIESVFRTLGISRPTLATNLKRHLLALDIDVDAPNSSLSVWDDESHAYRLSWCNTQLCWYVNLRSPGDAIQSTVIMRPTAKPLYINTPWQPNFALHANDRIDIMLSPHLGGEGITAFRVKHNKHIQSAYRYKDGEFYTNQGTRISPALSRQPVPKGWSISSSFNPHRLHPVTGVRRPHYGTDFPVPDNTPVTATGSGVVRIAHYSSSAGNYVEIEHDAHYKTHYFHLNHLLVKEGQHVKRGQRIGLSGHSGLSSGPHLHYELLKDGKPLDAMRTIALTSTALPNAELTQFKMNYQNKIKWPSTLLP
ncbi:peptidoglycan DD-metalloendopeptidase family protein [Vibrio alginolyticus]|uniref:peptidoglycan DD-metalloendopeptidase family protein n=1 Tax=Vibrio alginolyticus TaxID=663 RepID=UPI002119BB59|nr:peptidoglycan DD-metalloendopeptidase family protein [Vibrio alginolyticus]MCQ9087122.1 peptidoglycan DD-metalloendopeptidase family protein [Vibrio alginolyticus]